MRRTELQRLIDVAGAISSQSDYPSLFRMVVKEAMDTLDAEGGTLYLHSKHLGTLEAVVVVNNPLQIAHSIYDFIPNKTKGLFRIQLPTTHEKSRTLAGACWQTRLPVLVSDIANCTEFELDGVKDFDSKNNYQTTSICAVPLRTRDGEVIGVVQLVNAKAELLAQSELSFIEAMAGSMGMALEISILLRSTEDLLYSVVSMISKAIDRRSDTTGGHCTRVTELTMLFMDELVNDPNKPFKDLSLGPEDLNTAKIAAQLHDVGKIATPDHVLDKSKKLEKVFDRIDLVRERFKRRWSVLRCAQLEQALTDAGCEVPQPLPNEDDDMDFIERMNTGGEVLQESDKERIDDIAARDVGEDRMLSDEEVYNLSIGRGTLNPEERKIMQDHAAISIELLNQLPWPGDLKNVPDIAGKHHESINGKGYPAGITGDQMSIPAKILAIVDRFEGLSAVDRAYRNKKKLSQVMAIMDKLRDVGEIDPELYKYFVDRGMHLTYARRHLPAELIDMV